MSAAKHTQGEWVVDWNDGYGSPSIWAGSAPSGHGPTGELIATVHGDNAHTEDHARLIAAAPDLLAALKAVTQHAVHDPEGSLTREEFDALMAQADAAVAKAVGGAE